MRADMSQRENRVRQRAEKLWEEAGKPVGQDAELWHQAEVEIDAEDASPPPPAPAR